MRLGRKKSLLPAMIIFAAALLPAQIAASPYISLPTGVTAQVVEIIDINAIRVRTADGDALVRLIGLHTGATPQGINFLTREIMGNNVQLVRDPAFPNVGRWNYMYIMHQGRFINGELVLTGFARLNEGHSRAAQFENISLGQTIAREAGLGQWAAELREPIITQYGERININTATAAQIMAHLDAEQALADSIVAFRNFAVFQTVNDVKFVPGMGRDFFMGNRHRITVSTNVNTASQIELESLFNVGEAQALAIINARTDRSFTELEQLVSRWVMTPWQLNANMPFIALAHEDIIQFARPNYRANMNTATAAQLTRAGVPHTTAAAIVQSRAHMPLRNIQDIVNAAGFMTLAQANALADNLRPFTDVNAAPRSEIASLFGGYEYEDAVNGIMNNRPFVSLAQISQFMSAAQFSEISPFIYINHRPADVLVNINTATHSQLVAAGFPADIAGQLADSARRNLWLPSDIPTWIGPELRQFSTLYTNINTATTAELLSLDDAMTHEIVNRIMLERGAAPFGSLVEIEEFFSEDTAMWNMFMRFRPFIIIR